MIQGRNFVFTGLQPWDIPIGSNARDIALEISKHNRVLYINTPLSSIGYIPKSDNPFEQQRVSVLKGKAPVLRQLNQNLWILDFPFTIPRINSLPDGKIFDWFNKKSNRKMFKFIKEELQKLNFDNIIHFIDNDIYRSFYSKEFLSPSISIYYKRDNLLSIDFWKRHACRLEPLLIAKSDIVVCNSSYIASLEQRYNLNTYDIGQGIDLDEYSLPTYELPEDIKKIPHPIVGYMGYITSLRLDADLLYNLALQNSKCSFVLVGGLDTTFEQHVLCTLPNVYCLGAKERNTVPNYISGFDICINPQIINDATIGNYPRKIDEYLALGKPTIATRTETMKMFDGYVYLCDSLHDYQHALNTILKEENLLPQKNLIEFAHTHTWENSVKSLYQTIQKYEHK